MKPCAFDYTAADTLSQACELMATAHHKPLAGSQSLGPMLNLRLAQPESLVDLTRARELRSWQRVKDGIVIGAAITHAEIEDGLLPGTTGDILCRIARGIAYRAVRSRGTIGGSLVHADPSADWATTLGALGAQVILHQMDSGKLTARRMELTDFIKGSMQTRLDPGELLSAVYVPAIADGHRFGYFKLCRKTGELAHAMSAVLTDAGGQSARVVIGALPGAPMLISGPDALQPDVWRETLSGRYPDLPDANLALRLHVTHKALERSKTQ